VPGQSAASLELPVATAVAAGISRREVFLWIVIGLIANQALQLVDTGSLEAFAASLAAQNYIYWLACYAVIYRLQRSDGASRATPFDWVLALAIGLSILLTSFLPYRFAIGLLATLIAVYFLSSHGGDRNLKAAGGVLLALSAHLVWGPILFQFFTPELLHADAALVGEILASLRPDIIWKGTTFQTPEGHSIVLVGACSSFNNVSTAVLACATIAMLTRTEWVRRDIATAAIASVVMILANAARLCLVGWSGAAYSYWHNGVGAQMLGIAQTLVILLIAWWGATAPSRRTA
jgi:hypothetical protein